MGVPGMRWIGVAGIWRGVGGQRGVARDCVDMMLAYCWPSDLLGARNREVRVPGRLTTLVFGVGGGRRLLASTLVCPGICGAKLGSLGAESHASLFRIAFLACLASCATRALLQICQQAKHSVSP